MIDSIKEVNSIFEQPWWLEAVAPGQWKCAEVIENGHIVARLPYVEKRSMGFPMVGMPSCTQTIGPWISIQSTNRVKSLTKKKDLIEALIDKLPKKRNVDLVLDNSADYYLPFKWNGFKIEPTISYRYSDLSDLDAIFKCIKDSRRTVIKNAAKELVVKETDDIELLLEMQRKTFERQGRSMPGDIDVIRRLDKACREHNASFLLVAYDQEENLHAASYFVYDENVCYYILSGADPEYRNSGAGSLLIWEGIKRASELSKAFDFEGSNIMDIEKNFRTFGAPFIVNYRVFRLNFLLAAADYFKPKIKKIIGYKD